MAFKTIKLLSAILFLAVSVATAQSAWNGVAIDTSWYNTSQSQFTIDTPEKLAGLAVLVNGSTWPAVTPPTDNFQGKTITLGADIDLNSMEWRPIGDNVQNFMGSGTQFLGTFDGNGHSISNLLMQNFNPPAPQHAGLFGVVGVGGQIKNLVINVLRIIITTGNFAGGLVGMYNSNAPIENCGVNIRDSIVNPSGTAGGLIGRAESSNIEIINSYVIGGRVSAFQNSGGLIGWRAGSIAINNSYSTSNVSGTQHAGGLIGFAGDGGTINNSYSTGNVHGNFSGGLVGQGNTIITHSYSMGNVTGTNRGGIFGAWTGGASGHNSVYFNNGYGLSLAAGSGTQPAVITGISPSEFRNESIFVSVGWNFNNIWYMDIDSGYPKLRSFALCGDCGNNPCTCSIFSGGNGTENDPYIIKTAAELAHLAGLVNVGNPNFNTAHYKLGNDIVLNDTTENGGWRYWNSTTGLNNWTPIGTDDNRFMGVFDGANNVVAGVYINSIANNIGFFGSIGNAATVKNLGVIASFVRGNSNVGGFVGTNHGTITNCYATGNVQAPTVPMSGISGGFAGGNFGAITNCYATGNVVGGTSVGGFVGGNNNTIMNCYSTGSVTGSSFVGGLVGINAGTIVYSYYNTETSGQTDAGKGIPKTTAEMKQRATFTGWDFDSIWYVNQNNDYPRLRSFGNIPNLCDFCGSYPCSCSKPSTSIEVVLVEAGTYVMGDTRDVPFPYGLVWWSPETESVTITEDFWISKYPVTQAQYQAVMGNNPSNFSGHPNNPVEQVNWHEAVAFATAVGGRLPTQQEWEWAARGGKKTKNYLYSGSDNIDDVAWYWQNSSSGTQPVGTKAPNELGIYDMSGNVWEWTATEDLTFSSSRVVRGGSWISFAEYCRVANRYGDWPDFRDIFLGFRVAFNSHFFELKKIRYEKNNGLAAYIVGVVGDATTITPPPVPIKAGYDFAGWYKNAQLTEQWNFTTDTVSTDTTLYAKWNSLLCSDCGNYPCSCLIINEANFPDSIFRNWVDSSLAGGRGVLTPAEISGVTNINAGLLHISDLTGIEHFTSLRYLHVEGNGITSLNVSMLTNLEVLIVGGNQLTSLDVTNNINLTELNVSQNQLGFLDVSMLTNLKTLDVGWNQLTLLDVSMLTNLEVFIVGGWQLTSLDVSMLTNLEVLVVNSTQLTSLDVSNNTNLEVLEVYGNQLTSLDVTNNSNLEQLYVSSNQLTSLDVSTLTNLEILFVGENQLSSLDLSNNIKLSRLGVGGSQLTSLDVANNISLEHLYVFSNQLTSLDLSGLNDLQFFLGEDQTPTLTLSGSNNNYSVAIQLNNPTNLAAGITYENGILTSNSDTIASSPFSVATGNGNFRLSGTMSFVYECSDCGNAPCTCPIFSGGDGTENAPYIITTAAQLAKLAELVNAGNADFNTAHYRLGNDIMLNDTTASGGWQNWDENTTGLNVWTPIGTGSMWTKFGGGGTFDGNGYVISGIYGASLFGWLDGGTIKNLGVVASFAGQWGVGNSVIAGINSGTIINCYTIGFGFSGNTLEGNVINSYAINIKEDVYGTYCNNYVCNSKNITEIQCEQFVEQLNLTAAIHSMNAWIYQPGNYPKLSNEKAAINIANFFAGGDGTENNPYIINTKKQLEDFSSIVNSRMDFRGKFIKLGADIQLNDTTNWRNWDNYPPANEWVPISDYKFGGTFDGAGFVVSGVYINKNIPFTGLFGVIDSSAVIKNLGVVASYARIEDNNGQVGLVVGFNNGGTIINCYAVGMSSNATMIGGLVGTNGGTIKNSRAAVNIFGWGGCVGGLVGINSGTIENSYATGDINGYGASARGGLVGFSNGGIITNSYATGNVNANDSDIFAAGGLIGLLQSGSIITNSFATGNVTGSQSVGGLVAINYGTITNSYYNTETSGQTDTDKGTPKTTAEMKQRLTFTGWDFDSIWYINQNNDYPRLRSFGNIPNLCGDCGSYPCVCPCPHNFNDWETTTSATCEIDGEETEKCSLCGDLGTITRIIPALDHDLGGWTAWDTTKAATCTEAGSRTRTKSCERTNCGHSVPEIEPIDMFVDCIEINEINFPDSIFRNFYVSVHIAGGRDYLTPVEIARVTNITLDNFGVTNLRGIEFFTNLTYLHIPLNKLISIDLSWLNHPLEYFSAHSQTPPPLVLMESGRDSVTGDKCYRVAIELNNPTDLADGITYENGVLTSRSDNIASSPFSVATGNDNFRLTGTLSFIYEDCRHEFSDWEIETAATCTTMAQQRRTCNRCNLGETRDVGEALGHDMPLNWSVVKSATCTEAGERERVCNRTNCTHRIMDNPPALGHNFNDWETTTPATCEIDGEETEKCSLCGVLGTITYPIEKLGHDLGEWSVWDTTKAATCTETGTRTRTQSCTRDNCGHDVFEMDGIMIDSDNHELENVPEILPRCGVAGIGAGQECLRCEYKIGFAEIEALEHDFDEWSGWDTTKVATCDEEGSRTRTQSCTRDDCLHSVPETQNINVLTDGCDDICEHDWSEWTTTTPATCVTVGEETRTCGGCGEKETRPVAIPSAHEFGEWETETAATCVAREQQRRVCNLCAHEETQETGELAAHNFGGWIVTTPAICGVAGVESRTCGTCAEIDTRPIPALTVGCPLDITDKFTDPVLLAEIYRLVGKTPPSRIFDTDVAGIDTLKLSGNSTLRSDLLIRELNGIQHLVSLKFLDVSGNNITVLDLPDNPNIEHIDVRNNQLVRINITHNIALKFLDVSENNLTALDVSGNRALEEINAGNNQLMRIDLTHNIALKFLDVSENQLATLDVSNNPALERLDASENQLTRIDLTHNIALKYLDVSANNLEPKEDILGVRTDVVVIDHSQTPPPCVPFDQLVIIRFGTTMAVINNPNNSYRKLVFDEYEWYLDGELIGTAQSYYAGPDGIPAGKYHVIAMNRNVKLKSCYYTKSISASMRQHSELIKRGTRFYMDANMDESLLEGAEIVVFNTVGSVIARVKVTGRITELDPRLASGHLFKLVGKNGLNRNLRKVTVE